jgi:4-hydroxybenzoate polyprenyltransferase
MSLGSMPPHSPLENPAIASTLPLCVDLDGTVVRSDTLLEGIFALPFSWRLPWCFAGLFSGRAVFKKRVAELTRLDPAALPYNDKFLAYLQVQKSAGRPLYLVTAAAVHTARLVADHLELFDDVIASADGRNLKGRTKAEALAARFGEKGFVYAGNSGADVPVWSAADSAITVNASPAVTASAKRIAKVEAEFDQRPSPFAGLLRAMRPHQWIKNVLVFIPIITAHAIRDWNGWIHDIFAFLAFCSAASGIYLLNDLSDLSADRRHPRKSQRPFASGAVPLHLGALVAVVLLIAGIALAMSGHVLVIILIYAAMSIAYSAKLKEMPLVDVFMLAALYTIRLFGGGEASGNPVSFWLLTFSNFLFLSLALVKRVAELKNTSPGESNIARRGYRSADLALLQMFGCGSALAASMVLALFVQSEAIAERYASPALLWTLVPLILFWQFRIWLATTRGEMRDDPITFAAGDWVTWLVGAACFAILFAAKSLTLR